MMKIFSNILLVRLDHVGDCVMTAPAVAKALREALPDARISLLTTARNERLVRADPHIDEIIIYDAPWSVRPEGYRRTPRILYLKRLLRLLWMSCVRSGLGRYDAVVYLSYSYWERLLTTRVSEVRVGFSGPYQGRLYRIAERRMTKTVVFDEKKHLLQNCYELVGQIVSFPNTPLESQLVITKEDCEQGRRLIRATGQIKPPVMGMHPGGGRFRSWAPENYAALACWFSEEQGGSVIVLAGPDEADLAVEVARLACRDNVKALVTRTYSEFMLAVCNMQVFVGNDTGPTHIAAACGVPTVALFGPTNETIFAPPGANVEVIKPAEEYARWRIPWRSHEPLGRERLLMEEIAVETVCQTVDKLNSSKDK